MIDPEPEVVATDEVGDLLARLQRAILSHPVAAQALFQALVAEGRAWASTPEGALRREQLSRSELVVRSRVLWDALTVRAMEDDADTVLPSAVLEAMVKAASEDGMAALVEDLFVQGVLGGRG